MHVYNKLHKIPEPTIMREIPQSCICVFVTVQEKRMICHKNFKTFLKCFYAFLFYWCCEAANSNAAHLCSITNLLQTCHSVLTF